MQQQYGVQKQLTNRLSLELQSRAKLQPVHSCQGAMPMHRPSVSTACSTAELTLLLLLLVLLLVLVVGVLV